MAGKVIACLLAPEFEDSEFQVPYEAFKSAGHHVDIIGAKAGDTVKGHKGKTSVAIEKRIDEARPGDYDLLFIPGGHSPDYLRADPRFVEFARAFDQSGKPIAAVCHGPQLLAAAHLVRGRTLTAWKTIQDDLSQMGATVKDEAVVEDKNWITSRNPSDLKPFSDAAIRALQQ